VIGRAVECDIAVTADEISRRHALVKPTSEGLAVEDLGSANGTYINNKRVQNGFLNPGDELRLDAVRFIMVAPGMDMSAPASAKPAAAPVSVNSKLQMWAAILLTLAAVAVMVLLVTKK
jgi:pSer/pThr/pTyr-binding forkhead associated (FHA) protein